MQPKIQSHIKMLNLLKLKILLNMQLSYITFSKIIMYIINHCFIALIRAKTVGVRGLVINEDQQILLIKHTYKPGWHMPGGGVNSYEHPLDALKRELQEEACILVTEDNPRLIGIFHQRYFWHDDYPLMYIIHHYEPIHNAQPDFEIEEIRWFNLDQLESIATTETFLHIKNYLNQIPPNQNWSTKQ